MKQHEGAEVPAPLKARDWHQFLNMSRGRLTCHYMNALQKTPIYAQPLALPEASSVPVCEYRESLKGGEKKILNVGWTPPRQYSARTMKLQFSLVI